MARNRMTIACRTRVSTRGTEVSRCIAKPAGLQRGEKQGGGDRPDRLSAGEQRRHQPGPGVGRRQQRAVDEAELRAEHNDRARRGRRSRRSTNIVPDRLPSEPHAAVSGETRVLAPHTQFVARARSPVDEDDGERDRRDEETADVERPGEDVEARVRRDHHGLRQAGRNVAKGKAREIGCRRRPPGNSGGGLKSASGRRDGLRPKRRVRRRGRRRTPASASPATASKRAGTRKNSGASAPMRPPMTSWPSPPRFTMPPRSGIAAASVIPTSGVAQLSVSGQAAGESEPLTISA